MVLLSHNNTYLQELVTKLKDWCQYFHMESGYAWFDSTDNVPPIGIQTETNKPKWFKSLGKHKPYKYFTSPWI
jgi:hypothetical protein